MTSKDGRRLRCRDRKYDLFEERVVGYFPLDQKFRTVITRPGKLSRKYPGKAENCLISELWTIREFAKFRKQNGMKRSFPERGFSQLRKMKIGIFGQVGSGLYISLNRFPWRSNFDFWNMRVALFSATGLFRSRQLFVALSYCADAHEACHAGRKAWPASWPNFFEAAHCIVVIHSCNNLFKIKRNLLKYVSS